jgi:hypothetical protein
MSKFAPLWCAVVLLFCGSMAYAQPLSIADSTLTVSTTALADYYHQSIGQSSGLYSGIEFKPHAPNITGIPNYLNNDWNSGTVIYNHVVYRNVLLKYDLVDNQLVALLYNQVIPYILNQNSVQYFTVGSHHFVYAAADSVQHARESSFVPGFYEQVYNSKSEVLIRYEKTVETQTSSSSIESYYSDKTRLYLKNQGIYYEVSGNSAVAKVLKDQKKPVQQYLKSNHLKVNKSSPDALVKVATYYDSLTR